MAISSRSIETETPVGKMRYFLFELGEVLHEDEKLYGLTLGLCSGLTDMFAIAVGLGESESKRYLARLDWLEEIPRATLKNMASLYKQSREKSSQAERDAWENGLSEQDHILVEKARELYIFINAVVFAHQRINELNISKADFDKIVEIVAPDTLLKNPPEKKYTFGSTFTASELTAMLEKFILKDNFDYLKIGGPDHVIGLFKQNNHYIIFDSTKKGITRCSSPAEVMKCIEQYLFKDSSRFSDFMHVDFICFAKKSTLIQDQTKEWETILNKQKEKEPTVIYDELRARNKTRQPFELLCSIFQNRGIEDREAKLVRYLLKNNPLLIYEINKKGATLLHQAVQANNSTGVKLLLELGADPTAKNFEYKTPLQLAFENNDSNIYGLIFNYALLNKIPSVIKESLQQNPQETVLFLHEIEKKITFQSPQQKAQVITSLGSDLKKEIFEAIKKIDDKERKIELLTACLNKATAMGEIFAQKRSFFSPSPDRPGSILFEVSEEIKRLNEAPAVHSSSTHKHT